LHEHLADMEKTKARVIQGKDKSEGDMVSEEDGEINSLNG